VVTMLGPIGECSHSSNRIPRSFWVGRVVMVYESFARKLFTHAAVLDVVIARAEIVWANRRDPERLSF
jgi:hypothetical protein